MFEASSLNPVVGVIFLIHQNEIHVTEFTRLVQLHPYERQKIRSNLCDFGMTTSILSECRSDVYLHLNLRS